VSIATVPELTLIPVPAPTARPEEVVPKPEFVARRIEAPPAAVCKPPVVEGAKVKLMKANVDSLINGAEIAAKQSKFYMDEQIEQGLAIIISCVGRKSVLHQLVNEEVEVVADTFGKNYSYTGFYSYGEISTDKIYDACSLHNQTMTITNIIELD
jgi:hypothetical protein